MWMDSSNADIGHGATQGSRCPQGGDEAGTTSNWIAQMTETFSTINRWQRETFPDATLKGVLGHIKEEWKEFQDAVTVAGRVEEAVDMIILLSCYIDTATGIGAQLHVDDKMRRNRARMWEIQSDGTGRHRK
jgi:hypothetical protein